MKNIFIKKDILEIKRRATYGSLLYLLFMFFVLNPLFGLISIFIYLLVDNKKNKFLMISFPFLVAFFIGCINSTKVVENDLIWYLSGYLDAGGRSLLEYIITFGINGMGRELAFPVFNYIVYQFIGDNPKGYVLVHSFVAYSLLNMTIYKFGKAMKIPNKFIVTSIFIMSFTPYIFTMSALLLRQFLASSLLMYIIVMRLFYHKKLYFLIFCMVLIHSSTFLFVPFLFLPFFKKVVTKNTIIYYLLIFVILFNIQRIALALLPLFSNVPVFSYIFLRASANTTFDLGQLSLAKIITSTLSAFLPLFLIYYLKPRLKKQNGLIHTFNILLILVIFIMSNLHQSELSNRLNFYVWQFFPLVFLLYIWYFNVHKYILLFIGFFIVFFFIYYLDVGMWSYNINSGIYYYSIINYLM